MVGIAWTRAGPRRWCCSASAWAGSAARSTGISWSAATTAPRRRSIWSAERRTGEFLLGQIAAGRIARLPRPRRWRSRRGGGGDVPRQRQRRHDRRPARRRQRAGLVVRRGSGPLPAGRARRTDAARAAGGRSRRGRAGPRGRPHRRRRVDPRRRAPHIVCRSCARRTKDGCRPTWRPAPRPEGKT